MINEKEILNIKKRWSRSYGTIKSEYGGSFHDICRQAEIDTGKIIFLVEALSQQVKIYRESLEKIKNQSHSGLPSIYHVAGEMRDIARKALEESV